MSNNLGKVSARGQARNALERIESLEHDFQQIVGGFNNAFGQLQSQVRGMAEIVDAATRILGSAQIEEAVKAARLERAEAEATQAKEGLAKALEAKQVESVTKIEEDTLITGVEYDKAGNPLPPGYVQLNVGTVKPEYKEKMVGQLVPFKFEIENGTFEVTAAYKILPPVEAPTATEVPAEA